MYRTAMLLIVLLIICVTCSSVEQDKLSPYIGDYSDCDDTDPIATDTDLADGNADDKNLVSLIDCIENDAHQMDMLEATLVQHILMSKTE